MNIQSLSVVVPNPHCINHCAFCVSCMREEHYKDQMNDNLPFFDLYLKDYLKRLEFARKNGCNTVMLTGNSEPQQNRKFLTYFGLFQQMMKDPFQWVEMQTTGVLLDRNYLRFLRNHVGVNLISLSISSFDDVKNQEIIGAQDTAYRTIKFLCDNIKEYDFTLRLSLNLSKDFERYAPRDIFGICRELGADQVTLRVLYTDGGSETSQAKWVKENAASKEFISRLNNYVLLYGKKLGVLPYGATKYSLDGMSVVLDTDCMAKSEEKKNMTETYKYLILRPDCKLYSQWDDPASLIF